MKKTRRLKLRKSNRRRKKSNDQSLPDKGADRSGTDTDSDITHISKEPSKFDKPKREVDPDRTGIDTESDKTTKEK